MSRIESICPTCAGSGAIQDEYVENAMRTCYGCDGLGLVGVFDESEDEQTDDMGFPNPGSDS